MKRMYSSITHILVAICLVWAMGACNQTPTSKEDKKNNKDATDTKGMEAIPSTLDNFDVTYYGRYKGQQTQLNLRRYGTALSGNWWKSDKEEILLAGGLQGTTDQFQLELTNLKGDKVGSFQGKLGEDRGVKGFLKITNTDSVAIDFLPMARNVKMFRIKLDDMRSNKVSQNGKRQISITYPQILGVENPDIAKRVNTMMDEYFNANTWADSLEKGDKDFKEEVRYDITQLTNELISVCKHHHLDKNDGHTLFDDSHGVTINFKRGKIYELRDLFKANAIEALNKMLLARISKSCNNALTPAILDKCKMKGEETTSFSLGKGKITFHLTERLPYQSRGCGYLRLEYKDLRDFINPSGPLSDYLYDNTEKK